MMRREDWDAIQPGDVIWGPPWASDLRAGYGWHPLGRVESRGPNSLRINRSVYTWNHHARKGHLYRSRGEALAAALAKSRRDIALAERALQRAKEDDDLIVAAIRAEEAAVDGV